MGHHTPFTALILFALCLLLSTGRAGAQGLAFTVVGVGQDTCGSYLRAVDDEGKVRPPDAPRNGLYTTAYAEYWNWMQGFLSGYNAGDPALRMLTGGEALGFMAWMTKRCREHPLELFGMAAYALRWELAKNAAPVPPTAR